MTAFNDVALNFSNVILGFQTFDRELTGGPQVSKVNVNVLVKFKW